MAHHQINSKLVHRKTFISSQLVLLGLIILNVAIYPAVSIVFTRENKESRETSRLLFRDSSRELGTTYNSREIKSPSYTSFSDRDTSTDSREFSDITSRLPSQSSFRFEEGNELLGSTESYRDSSAHLSRYYDEVPVSLDTEKFSADDNDKEIRIQHGDGKVKWEGWNYVDTSKGNHIPHEKTISFQYLDDDNRYAHAPPAWPHDEYLLHFPIAGSQGLRNNGSSDSSSTTGTAEGQLNESDRNFEWQKLRPKPVSSNSVFMGPGFYDYGSGSSQQYNYPASALTHQAITDGTITTSSASGSDSQNSVSETASNGKLYGGPTGLGYGNPYDYYKRKRLRLKIHPGLLAAPIAGFAAYKAVSAIASKPLLFELGWVNNKPTVGIGGGGWGLGGGGGGGGYPYPYPQPIHPYPQPIHPYPQPVYPGGGGQYPPVVHPIYLPQHQIGHAHAESGPKYPILRPQRYKPSGQRSAWWNPFAALTPRFRSSSTNSKKDTQLNYDDDCNNEVSQ